MQGIDFKEKKQISFNEASIVGNEIISLFDKKEFEKRKTMKR